MNAVFKLYFSLNSENERFAPKSFPARAEEHGEVFSWATELMKKCL